MSIRGALPLSLAARGSSSPLLIAALFVLCLRPAVAQITESTGTVRLQAEAFSSSIPRTIDDPNNGSVAYAWQSSTAIGGFSGTGLVQVLPNNGTSVVSNWQTTSPELRYTVNFSNAGTYYVWLRGYAETSENLSVYVGLNGSSPVAAQVTLPRTGTWSWSGGTAGVAVAVTVPSPGTHTLNLWMGDAGFAIDRIILTLNAGYSPEFSAGFWRNQNIYQIITDRFFDGDPSNNNIYGSASPSTGNRTHGGDWKGVLRKLDYIKALGATAIWLSPVLRNANGDFDYHGYAATDFYNVDPRFGTLQDLQRLVAEAHRRGILVINDVVVNHGSTWVDSGDSGWAAFRYPPSGYNLRYNSGGRQYAPPFDNASINAAFGNSNLANIFHNNGGTQNWADATQVELGELVSLDDFRTESSYVRARMKEIWTYWINTVGFDAYRLDTVKHVEMGFWDEWNPAIRTAAQSADKPNFFQFGEVFDGSDSKVGSYTGTKSGGNYKMESVLDYPLYYQMGSVFATATGNTGQLENRYNNLTTANYDASSLDSLVLNLDNHDNPRFLNASGSSPARLDLALVFLYTSRGIPSLYYGTEQDFNGGADPANREDMFDGAYEQGPSLGDNFNMTAARFKLVAKLNNLRRLYPALRTGTHVNLWANWSAPGLFAYARRAGNQEAYVVLNTATTAQAIGDRPTIHPAGTVLVNVLNPSERVTVVAGVDGIPGMSIPATSAKIFVAQNQVQNLDPVVAALTPSHDATGISTGTSITVTFDRAMNTSSVQADFSTAPATTGTFSWNAGNTALTYTPFSPLAGNTLYTVRIGGGAAASDGLSLHAPFESSFTTGAAAALARPSVNSSGSDNVTDDTALLLSTVTPNGASTTVSFEYGTSTSYGTITAAQPAGSGNSPVAISAALAGLVPGTTYHFRAVAQNSQGTTRGPDTTLTTTKPQPQVTTTAATSVTTVTASLNGTVNPNGLPTAIFFEYGNQSDKLDQTTAPEDVGSGSANIDRWASIGGLEPDTTYFYRMVAESGGDRVNGSVLSFRSLPVKPTVVSTAVQNVNPSTATLSTVVDPNGTDSQVWFEYGADTTYGAATAPRDLPAAGGRTASVSDLAGLVFGQTYHYRAVARNSFGTTYGADGTFTTGYPPPTALTGDAAPTSSTANLTALVNPNGPDTVYWFEYGTGGAYPLSTRSGASDNAEAYTSFAYASGSSGATATQNRGSGFGSFTSYVSTSSSRGGIRLVNATSANGTAGRQIDGVNSFGIFAGTSTSRGTHQGYRPLSTPRSSGRVSFTVRFDISNEKGFTGINIKSANGTTFGANELLSIGMAPAGSGVGGNNALMVTDADGQKNVDLGAECRGAVIDVRIDFDTRAGTYTCGIKYRQSSGYVTTSGRLKLSGAAVNLTAFGYINGNNIGNNAQHMILDAFEVSSAVSAGSGIGPVPVSANLSGLAANTVYNYRVAASSAVGTTYGEAAAFATGPDLAVAKTHTGDMARGGNGEFTVTVSNEGGTASAGTVTITEQPAPGMMIKSMSGPGWTFRPESLTCTRSDALGAGSSYPPVVVSVALAPDAAPKLTNAVSVAGGGDLNPANNAAAREVNVTPAPASGIAAWRQKYFGSTEDSGAGADLNVVTADGLPNIMKYAFGLDPTSTAQAGERPRLSGFPPLSMSFRRSRDASDVTIAVQAANDLQGVWTNIWSSSTNAYGGGSEPFTDVTVEDPVSPGGDTLQRYLRLNVTRP